MLTAIVTDTHFGARGDSVAFDDSFKKFFDEVFFPTLERRKIKTIFHLGDLFDKRKQINFQTLESCRRYFLDRIDADGYTLYIIPGNHDTYYKNTNDVNALNLLLSEYKNVNIIGRCAVAEFDGLLIGFVPWICDDNYDTTMKFLDTTKAKVLFGHLELKGFEMHRGQPSEVGFDRELFRKFDLVCSGHFHHRSHDGAIHYLGTPYEMTWADYDDPKGFHLFDTDEKTLDFVGNTSNMFYRIEWNDGRDLSASIYTGKIVKLVVINKTNHKKFDAFVDDLYKHDVLELKIVEDLSEFESVGEQENIDIEDTMTLLSEYVDHVETDMDKEKLKTVLKTLYIEAQHNEDSL